MIGKAKSNKSLAATIEYNLKEKAELFFTNKLTGATIEEYQMQMHDLQKCYRGYARRLTIHAILSPHINEGNKLEKEQWNEIANDYLNLMNLQEYQAIGFIHRDKEHRHLHLVINKVNEQTFKLYHDGFIGKRTQHAADKIAEKMGLIRAMEIKQKNIQNKKRQKEATQNNFPENSMQFKSDEKEQHPLGSKQLFKLELQTILANKNIRSINDFFEEIKKAGFKLHLYHNKDTKELRGYGIEKNDTKLDASIIGKEFTIKNLQPFFESNSNNIENSQVMNIAAQVNKIEEIEPDEVIEETSRQWKMRR